MRYIVKDKETGRLYSWGIKRVLNEINKDHSAEFTPYNKTDWKEGWDEWVDYYELIGSVK